jgi:hypothetical protein
MESIQPENVIVLYPRLPRPTFCQDCDPDGSRPFSIGVRSDPRTGDILTPCPACDRHALALLPWAAGRRKLGR